MATNIPNNILLTEKAAILTLQDHLGNIYEIINKITTLEPFLYKDDILYNGLSIPQIINYYINDISKSANNIKNITLSLSGIEGIGATTPPAFGDTGCVVVKKEEYDKYQFSSNEIITFNTISNSDIKPYVYYQIVDIHISSNAVYFTVKDNKEEVMLNHSSNETGNTFDIYKDTSLYQPKQLDAATIYIQSIRSAINSWINSNVTFEQNICSGLDRLYVNSGIAKKLKQQFPVSIVGNSLNTDAMASVWYNITGGQSYNSYWNENFRRLWAIGMNEDLNIATNYSNVITATSPTGVSIINQWYDTNTSGLLNSNLTLNIIFEKVASESPTASFIVDNDWQVYKIDGTIGDSAIPRGILNTPIPIAKNTPITYVLGNTGSKLKSGTLKVITNTGNICRAVITTI